MKLRGSVTVFAMILLGLVLSMWLFGYSSLASSFFTGDFTNLTAEKVLNSIWNALTSQSGITLLGLGVTFAVLTVFGSGGYIAGNIIPFVILTILVFLFANVFFFPIFSDPEFQVYHSLQPITFMLSGIYNVLLLLTVITFIGGRD